MQIPVNGVPIDGELDVAADFVSPALPGRYISYWRMAYPSGGKFGQRVWVLIEVLAFLVLPSSPFTCTFSLHAHTPESAQ